MCANLRQSRATHRLTKHKHATIILRMRMIYYFSRMRRMNLHMINIENKLMLVHGYIVGPYKKLITAQNDFVSIHKIARYILRYIANIWKFRCQLRLLNTTLRALGLSL
jgi:hypothetical protein